MAHGNEPHTPSSEPKPRDGAWRLLGFVLSYIVPGAGHVVRIRARRGYVWTGGYALIILLLPIVPGHLWVLLALMLGSAIDGAAIRGGTRAGQGAVAAAVVHGQRPSGKSAGAISAAMVVGGFLVLRLIVGPLHVHSYQIHSNAMTPNYAAGAYVLVWRWAYAVTEPEPGDVIVHESPCHSGKDFVSRIVAVEGQTAEVRCGRLFVDGKAVERDDGDLYEYTERSPHAPEETRRLRLAREKLGATLVDVGYDAERQPTQSDFPTGLGFECGDGTRPGPFPNALTDYGRPGEPPDSCGPTQGFEVPQGYVFTISDNRDHALDSRIQGPVSVDAIRGKVVQRWLQ